MSRRSAPRLVTGLVVAGLALALAAPALAQIAHHPFAVGANEGAVGHQSGLGAWILAQESTFYRGLTAAVRAADTGAGLALLIGLSFAYGIFHAAGPGHGKAVVTSYLVSNEVALRRGLVIALLAALLQGLVATAIVGVAAFVFDATAPRMTAAAQAMELISYLGIVALGLMLVWRKGRAVALALRPAPVTPPLALAALGAPLGSTLALRGALAPPSRFFADDGRAHIHGADCDCGATHMPDPTRLGSRRFDLKAAGITVLSAGARPCSGAILVLVFALSQGRFLAGIAATFAMALGTAITTGALAGLAVFAKDVAVRWFGGGDGRTTTAARLLEFGAAVCVLVFGLVLVVAALSGVRGGA